jgi:hypothetical protein
MAAQCSALWDLLWNKPSVLAGLTTAEPFATSPLHQHANFGGDDPMDVNHQDSTVTSIDLSQPCFKHLRRTILGDAKVLLVRQEYHEFVKWQTERISKGASVDASFVTSVLTGQPGIGERPDRHERRFQAHHHHREELLLGLASLDASGSWPTDGPPNHPGLLLAL